MSYENAIQQIEDKHNSLINTIQEITEQIEALKSAGVMYGKPSYKGGKYLRLIQGKGQDRVFKYIGSDPDTIKTTLEQVERGNKVNQLQQALEHEQGEYSRFLSNLGRVLWW